MSNTALNLALLGKTVLKIKVSLLRAWMKAGTRQIVATLDSLGRAHAHLHSHIPVENNLESSPNQKCIILPDILKSPEGPGNLPTQGSDPHTCTVGGFLAAESSGKPLMG